MTIKPRSSILAKGFALLTLGATLGGCFYPHYPSAWSPVVETRDPCPKLSGVYNNYDDDDKKQSLTSIFDLVTSSAVMISGVEDGVLEVTSLEGGLSTDKKRLIAAKGEFSCQDGWVELKVTGFSGPQFAGPHSEYTQLSTSLDGSIVAKQGVWAVGLGYLVLPLGVSGYDWYRFRTRDVK